MNDESWLEYILTETEIQIDSWPSWLKSWPIESESEEDNESSDMYSESTELDEKVA